MAVVGRENWQYQDSISKYVLMRYAQVLIRYFSCKKYRLQVIFRSFCISSKTVMSVSWNLPS